MHPISKPNYQNIHNFLLCEAWFLAVRKEYRLRVFENGLEMSIFGSKREEGQV
jgi:hypothetical protein